MKFKIYRTSDYYGREQPHPKAVDVTPIPKPNPKYEGSVAELFEEQKKPNPTFIEPKKWEIEVNTLEELIEIVREESNAAEGLDGIIIYGNPQKYEIEIYDDYRE